MYTQQDVDRAFTEWIVANIIAQDAALLPSISQEALDHLWTVEAIALETYTHVYNAFQTQQERL